MTDAGAEDAVRVLRSRLAEAAPGTTFCPSGVARRMAPAGGDWRALMPTVRDAAARLADGGELVVTRAGEPVDPRAARGPVRLGPPQGTR